ncbi:MAG: PH domain-containing protein [Candidatus Uhrbacteria bacterium]|nr:PH domain-containing protein [Candidatus Uhrbacteria bacterium]
MLSPDHIPNKRNNEKIVLFLRRHWFAVLSLVVSFILLTVIPIGLAIYFWDTLSLWLAEPFFGVLLSVLISMYFLGVWLVTATGFTDYYLDTWIVTNERIINIEQQGLFQRVASELDLTTVQDVTAEISGVLETLFQFGDVEIQTAGEREHFEFRHVPHPEHVKEVIMQLVQADKRALATGQTPPA